MYADDHRYDDKKNELEHYFKNFTTTEDNIQGTYGVYDMKQGDLYNYLFDYAQNEISGDI